MAVRVALQWDCELVQRSDVNGVVLSYVMGYVISAALLCDGFMLSSI